MGIAQWVVRPAEKPGAILTLVPVPGAARDFLLDSVQFKMVSVLGEAHMRFTPSLRSCPKIADAGEMKEKHE